MVVFTHDPRLVEAVRRLQIAQVHRLIDTVTTSSQGVWPRSAALLARQALEAAVRVKLDAYSTGLDNAPFRAQLLCLQGVIGDNEVAREGNYLWSALSGATHHSGYGSPPGSGMVAATRVRAEMGFESEKVGLFGADEFALRPDYFLRLGSSGILLEVERGKTTINNMDLLDFWKCHLCRHAHYLFLLVPLALRQNPTMSPRNEFAAVARRLQRFFVADNYTNVRGLCLFGY